LSEKAPLPGWHRTVTAASSRASLPAKAAWERHPNGDELVQIVDGDATLQIVTEDGPQSVAVSAGMLAIVPQGTWHRFDYPGGVTLIAATPGPSEYVRLDIEDPRTVEPQRD
jgi:mannose-6-phosphate isomerase-like protein (cupin superfamily)